ncbi:MAG: galactokinase [Acidobacteria bacterium]|nr:galactokinase [Acidobacteriota bacterium]
MTAEAWLAQGFSGAEAQSRADLQRTVTARFSAVHGRTARWGWWVPGRVEWFGKHTDYAGGDSLVSAVPRGFVVAARPRDDDRLTVLDACDGTRGEWQTGRDGRPPVLISQAAPGWAVYVQTVAGRLAANFPDAPAGIDIVVASDLPRAAGLSSSSAFMIGVALALIRRGALETHPSWTPALRTRLGLAWYLGCVENGSRWGSLAGDAGVGTHGGSEDHVAILTSHAHTVGHYGYVPVRLHREVPLPAGVTLLVATSGVQAEKTGAAMAAYNRAADAVHRMQAWWNRETGDSAVSLIAVLARADAPARLRRWIATQPDAARLDARLQHLQREQACVAQASHALADGDVVSLGDLAAASQRDAELLLGNQGPETLALVDMARRAGAYAASAFGAGFGGSVWALVPDGECDAIAQAWRAAYVRDWPWHASRCEVFAASPAPGVCDVPMQMAT